MKFSALFAFVTATSLASAASVPRDENKEEVHPFPHLIWPHRTLRRFINSGQAIENPHHQPLVLKGKSPAEESSAIVTFDVPPWFAGHLCKFVFELSPHDLSIGSQTADVFKTSNPLESWIPSRDQQVGRIHTTAPGHAEWIQAYNGYPEFPCPAGHAVGYEFVGVSDEVAIGWEAGATGPQILVL